MENESAATRFPQAPTEEIVQNFWGFSRDHVGWATLEGIFGQQQASTMTPPWMHLSGNVEDATALARKLIAEKTLEVVEPEENYPDDGALPQRGDLAIVVDGAGRPVALAATLAVTVSDAPESTGRLVTETLRCLYPR